MSGETGWQELASQSPEPPYRADALVWLDRRFGSAKSQVLSGNLTDRIAPARYDAESLLELFDIEGKGHCFTVPAHQWARFHEPQITGGLVHFLDQGDHEVQLGRCLAFYHACARCSGGRSRHIDADDVIDWEVVEEEPTVRERGDSGRKRVERGRIDILVEFELEDGAKAGATVEAKFDHTLTPGQLRKYSAHLEDEREWKLEEAPLLLVTRQPEELRSDKHWQSVTWWRFMVAFEREIARSNLRILRTGTGSGLTIRDDDALLAPGTLTDQVAWFEAFDAFQRDLFIQQIAVEAERLAKSDDTRISILGRRIGEAVDRAGGDILRLLGEIAGQTDDLRAFANGLSEGIRRDIASPGNGFVKSDPFFMDALVNFVTDLKQSGDDVDEEDEDADEDDDAANAQSLEGRKLAVDVFRKAMRTLAMSQATGRKPGATSRAAKIAALITERGLDLPDLSQTGRILILQRAARRVARAPGAFIGSMPLRYRRFRRSMRSDGKWYGETPTSARVAHPAEIDLIILAMLRAARDFDADRLLSSRLSPDRRPPILDSIAALRRNQVLVDEVTDFSPLQLAAMAALSAPSTEAVFLSGDFNQRLTVQGLRSEEDLNWSVPGVDVHRIAVSYRQSRKLAAYARALARKQGATIEDRAPDYGENLGFDPVCGTDLDTDEKRAEWLARRIREIEAIGNGTLPTVAVLVSDKDAVEMLTEHLDRELAKTNLRARAYSAGNAIGHSQDVRVFSIEHIKGLEFEAVFFADVDRLAEAQPELFDRYIYVGATRAATFLGLTCSTPSLPNQLVGTDLSYGQSW